MQIKLPEINRLIYFILIIVVVVVFNSNNGRGGATLCDGVLVKWRGWLPKVPGVALPCDPEPAARMSAGFGCLPPGFPPTVDQLDRNTSALFLRKSSPPWLKLNFPTEVNGDFQRRKHALRGRPGGDLGGGERLPLPAVGSSSTGSHARPSRPWSRGRGGPGVPVG